MAAAVQRTWLVTGASSGFGSAIALAALGAGHHVIGTSRDVNKAAAAVPEFAKRGGIWRGLDPASGDAETQTAAIVKECEGGVDVLVNNAGYAFIGGVEDTSENEVRDQMEVNFYGPLRTIKAALPAMRERKAGDIVLISSGAGFIARPARSTYSASKFAIEAVHESLSHELKPFNINVLIVEPGAFRTSFVGRIKTPSRVGSRGFSDAYRDTPVEQMVVAMQNAGQEQAKGDPDKAARVIVNAVDEGHEYLRLPLGPDCVKAMETHIEELKRDCGATRPAAESTDFD